MLVETPDFVPLTTETPPEESEVTKLLREAKKLLEEVGWTQGAFARFENFQPKPVGFCAVGSLCWAKFGGEVPPRQMWNDPVLAVCYSLLSGIINTEFIANWNDRFERTYEDVIGAFDRAIYLSKACV